MLNRVFHDETFITSWAPVLQEQRLWLKKYNLNVLYKVNKVKRGHYECTHHH
jgi:hypothetical protein